MRKILIMLKFLLTIFSLGFCYINNQREIFAQLIKTNEKDTITFDPIKIDNSNIVDLRFCLENFKYPPKLSKDIFWIRPDTFGITIIEKENIKFKYEFDKNGRVILYYYQGSYISGIFPLPYLFKYDSKRPDKIIEVTDGFYKTKYRIEYDKNYNIKTIEKLDSLNHRLELLIIYEK